MVTRLASPKANVKRLSSSEIVLIDSVRNVGIENIYMDIKKATDTGAVGNSLKKLHRLLLRNENVFPVDTIKQLFNIEDTLLEELIEAQKMNRSIVVLGDRETSIQKLQELLLKVYVGDGVRSLVQLQRAEAEEDTRWVSVGATPVKSNSIVVVENVDSEREFIEIVKETENLDSVFIISLKSGYTTSDLGVSKYTVQYIFKSLNVLPLVITGNTENAKITKLDME